MFFYNFHTKDIYGLNIEYVYTVYLFSVHRRKWVEWSVLLSTPCSESHFTFLDEGTSVLSPRIMSGLWTCTPAPWPRNHIVRLIVII